MIWLLPVSYQFIFGSWTSITMFAIQALLALAAIAHASVSGTKASQKSLLSTWLLLILIYLLSFVVTFKK